jgi:hypothetical protein
MHPLGSLVSIFETDGIELVWHHEYDQFAVKSETSSIGLIGFSIRVFAVNDKKN